MVELLTSHLKAINKFISLIVSDLDKLPMCITTSGKKNYIMTLHNVADDKSH